MALHSRDTGGRENNLGGLMTVAYPLQWPAGWPRTVNPQNGQYKQSVAGALGNLKTEIGRLCGAEAAKTLVLSSNATLGHDNPKDCGVVAYVTWEGQSIAIPCDRWNRLEHNVQAIALTIEAMRAIERHGAKHMIKAMFTGFTALPAPKRHWRHVLTVAPGQGLHIAEKHFKDLAKIHHPDAGGTDREKWHEISNAIEAAREELK